MYVLLIAFVACFHLTQAQFPNGTNVTTVSFDNGNFNVSWMHNRTTDQLHFAVDVNTTGWVGFGFSFTPENMMHYDVVVGGQTAAGQNYLNDFDTTGTSRPPRDTKQSYTLENAAELNGITSLRFHRPRDTNDMQDIQFNDTTRVYLIWAYHDTEDADNPLIFSKHTHRNYTMETHQIVFPGENMTATTAPPTTPMVTTTRPSSGFQLGVSFLTISLATILSFFVK
ncbi:hypothetical protein ACROYT_G038170 [Oculina patagonica]